jgi:SAM-dependent methyltransferase
VTTSRTDRTGDMTDFSEAKWPSATAPPTPLTRLPGWCCGAWAIPSTPWTMLPSNAGHPRALRAVQALIERTHPHSQACRLPDAPGLAAGCAFLCGRAGDRAPLLHRRGAGRWQHRPLVEEHTRRVLDLCTGNGSLAVLAAMAYPDVTGGRRADISPDALAVARINVDQHG